MYPSLENEIITITVQGKLIYTIDYRLSLIIDTTVTQVSMLSLQTGYIGSSAVIVCNITLNTAIGPDLSILNYYWYHNNIDITNNITNQRLLLILSIDGMSFTTTLKITSVQSSNAGVYQCSAGIVGGNTLENVTKLCIKGMLNNCLI